METVASKRLFFSFLPPKDRSRDVNGSAIFSGLPWFLTRNMDPKCDDEHRLETRTIQIVIL